MPDYTMEQIGALFVKMGESLEKEASNALFAVCEDARDAEVDNLERGIGRGQASRFAKLRPLTLEIRKAQGISGKKPGIATGSLRRSMKSRRAIRRTGKFRFEIRPDSDAELRKKEFLINPAQQTVTKRQAGKLYHMTGKKVYVKPGSKIRKKGRNPMLTGRRMRHYMKAGFNRVAGIVLDGMGTPAQAYYRGKGA